MGPLDYGRAVSFLTDPAWLYANARMAPESAQGDAAKAVGAAAFATYPLWLWLGWDRGRRARGCG